MDKSLTSKIRVTDCLGLFGEPVPHEFRFRVSPLTPAWVYGEASNKAVLPKFDTL